VLRFDGFTRLYADVDASGEAVKEERAILPPLEAGMVLTPIEILPEQHFTEPPPRYSDASLIRALEDNGIGRPSTYATIVGTITTRDYVNREKGKLIPTDLGMSVNGLLVKILPTIFDIGFTAHMEEELDKVEAGTDQWRRVVREFYGAFHVLLEQAEAQKAQLKSEMQTVSNDICERCGQQLILKYGRNGPFLACPGYPECKFTKPLRAEEAPQLTDEKCPNCEKPLMIRKGRFGRFMACSGYPECKFTKPVTTGVPCPKCKVGQVSEKRSKRGRMFYGCNRYPECDFAAWDRPVNIVCEVCSSPYMVEKETQAKGRFYRCPSCKAEIDPDQIPVPTGTEPTGTEPKAAGPA
jgi:DNA topoisomerase-1